MISCYRHSITDSKEWWRKRKMKSEKLLLHWKFCHCHKERNRHTSLFWSPVEITMHSLGSGRRKTFCLRSALGFFWLLDNSLRQPRENNLVVLSDVLSATRQLSRGFSCVWCQAVKGRLWIRSVLVVWKGRKSWTASVLKIREEKIYIERFLCTFFPIAIQLSWKRDTKPNLFP